MRRSPYTPAPRMPALALTSSTSSTSMQQQQQQQREPQHPPSSLPPAAPTSNLFSVVRPPLKQQQQQSPQRNSNTISSTTFNNAAQHQMKQSASVSRYNALPMSIAPAPITPQPVSIYVSAARPYQQQAGGISPRRTYTSPSPMQQQQLQQRSQTPTPLPFAQSQLLEPRQATYVQPQQRPRPQSAMGHASYSMTGSSFVRTASAGYVVEDIFAASTDQDAMETSDLPFPQSQPAIRMSRRTSAGSGAGSASAMRQTSQFRGQHVSQQQQQVQHRSTQMFTPSKRAMMDSSEYNEELQQQPAAKVARTPIGSTRVTYDAPPEENTQQLEGDQPMEEQGARQEMILQLHEHEQEFEAEKGRTTPEVDVEMQHDENQTAEGVDGIFDEDFVHIELRPSSKNGEEIEACIVVKPIDKQLQIEMDEASTMTLPPESVREEETNVTHADHSPQSVEIEEGMLTQVDRKDKLQVDASMKQIVNQRIEPPLLLMPHASSPEAGAVPLAQQKVISKDSTAEAVAPTQLKPAAPLPNPSVAPIQPQHVEIVSNATLILPQAPLLLPNPHVVEPPTIVPTIPQERPPLPIIEETNDFDRWLMEDTDEHKSINAAVTMHHAKIESVPQVEEEEDGPLPSEILFDTPTPTPTHRSVFVPASTLLPASIHHPSSTATEQNHLMQRLVQLLQQHQSNVTFTPDPLDSASNADVKLVTAQGEIHRLRASMQRMETEIKQLREAQSHVRSMQLDHRSQLNAKQMIIDRQVQEVKQAKQKIEQLEAMVESYRDSIREANDILSTGLSYTP